MIGFPTPRFSDHPIPRDHRGPPARAAFACWGGITRSLSPDSPRSKVLVFPPRSNRDAYGLETAYPHDMPSRTEAQPGCPQPGSAQVRSVRDRLRCSLGQYQPPLFKPMDTPTIPGPTAGVAKYHEETKRRRHENIEPTPEGEPMRAGKGG
jgi:hypothetical protein